MDNVYVNHTVLPPILARITDEIFEGLPIDEAKLFLDQILSARRVGADLSKIWPQFYLVLIDDPDFGFYRHVQEDRFIEQRKSIDLVRELYLDYENITEEAPLSAARSAIRSAAASAWSAWSAAHAARVAYADSAAYGVYEHHQFMRDTLLKLLKEAPVND